MERPRAVVVLTGSELVRGDKADANGPFLARELTGLGLEPARMLVVGDDPAELEAALREGLEADLCVLSGGLGPTHDDRTVEMLARVAGRELVVDATLAAEIEGVSRAVAARLARPYADFEPGVRKQASLPEGGRSLGLAGTAPAVLLEHDGSDGRRAPRAPRRAAPALAARARVRCAEALLADVETPTRRVLRFFGPSESAVARVLEETGGEADGLEVTVCAQDLEIRVDLLSSAGRRRRSHGWTRPCGSASRDDLFAEDERTVGELVLARCRRLGLTLATAESCTGGLVGARLTEVPGSSDVFLGGIVSYSNEAKMRQLGVSPEVLERHGAVSAEAAEAMAEGARTALGADAAVSVTGIAGPDGGTPEKPVGLVVIAAVTPDRATTERIVLSGDREAVRGRATALALHTLRRVL